MNIGIFPADSETGTFCIDIKTFESNESHDIRNHKSKTGASMERFGNASHDDIQKLIDKSKNKNMTKTTVTWMNVYHTWAKHSEKRLKYKK